MKTITHIALLLVVCLAGASGKKHGSLEPYAFRHVEGPLSPEDIRCGFDLLGLRMERFTCYAPEQRRLRIFVRRYIHGAADEILGDSTVTFLPGDQRFVLFTREQNESLRFSFQVGGYRAGWDPISLEGYGARTWGRLNGGRLEKGRVVPFYAAAVGTGGVQSFPPDCPLDELVPKYALTLVFFAEVL